MKRAIVTSVCLSLVLALTPAAVRAQANGSIYVVQGASIPIFFNFSVSGQTFVATILTYGGGGNGRWFASFGTTNGTSGTGQIILPVGFSLQQPADATIQFQLDQPNGPAGSFTTEGLDAFLSDTSGRIVRIFP